MANVEAVPTVKALFEVLVCPKQFNLYSSAAVVSVVQMRKRAHRG